MLAEAFGNAEEWTPQWCQEHWSVLYPRLGRESCWKAQKLGLVLVGFWHLASGGSVWSTFHGFAVLFYGWYDLFPGPLSAVSRHQANEVWGQSLRGPLALRYQGMNIASHNRVLFRYPQSTTWRQNMSIKPHTW